MWKLRSLLFCVTTRLFSRRKLLILPPSGKPACENCISIYLPLENCICVYTYPGKLYLCICIPWKIVFLCIYTCPGKQYSYIYNTICHNHFLNCLQVCCGRGNKYFLIFTYKQICLNAHVQTSMS